MTSFALMRKRNRLLAAFSLLAFPVRVPPSQSGLNGEQHGKTVFNIAVTYLFNKAAP